MKISNGFENLARSVYRNRFKALAVMVCVIAALLSQAPKITVNTSTEGFLKSDDPALLAYKEFRKQFGRDELIILAVKTKELFTKKNLSELKSLHEDLKSGVPHLKDITSLVNARNTRGEGDTLIVEDLVEKMPETSGEMAALKERVRENPLYRDILVSRDLTCTTFILETHNYSGAGKTGADVMARFDEGGTDGKTGEESYLSDEENSAAVKAAWDIMKKHSRPGFEISMTGSAAVSHYLKESIVHDTHKFLRIAVLSIALFLFIVFRRVSGVLIPLFTVILSLASTIGFMGACGAAIKLPTQILPSFLLAVCIGDSVHVMTLFFRRYGECGNKEDAIAYAFGHSGIAIVMTSLTTAGGLISFATAKVAPIVDLGVYGAFGVMIALVYTIILTPVFVSIFPIKRPKQKTEADKVTFVDVFLTGVGNLSVNRPYAILTGTALIVIAALTGISRIHFSHDVLRWLPEGNAVRTATEEMDEKLKGTVNLEIVIDTGVENGLYDPALLNRLENSAREIETLSYGKVFAGKAWSITTILKEINRALNGNDLAHYAIPDSRDLISQEFLLFANSGSDDLEDFTDSQFRKARFIVKVPFQDAVQYTKFLSDVDSHFKKYYSDVNVTITGMITLFSKTIANALFTMASSYITAFIVITVLMALLAGNLKTGLVSMIPNLSPIAVTLGIMGWFSFPLNNYTMLVGSIAIGLVVDDTIHFISNFRSYFEQSQDAEDAIRKTLHSTGRAMLITCCVLSTGFFMFMLSSMNHLKHFGFLTGITIILALIADFLATPALMLLVHKSYETAKDEKEDDGGLLPDSPA
jgi:predicted RND superfamily exporter protein